MADDFYSRAHFEVRVDSGRRRESRRLGLCRVGPISSEMRSGDDGRPVAGHAPVVLRRALGEDRYLFDWRRAVADGKADARTVTVRIRGNAEEGRAIELRLEGCRPVRWSGPSLDAVEGGLAFEEVELEYERLVWA